MKINRVPVIVIPRPEGCAKQTAEYWEGLFTKAELAAQKGAAVCTPSPSFMFGQMESEGLCGFAWVQLPGARCSFAVWVRRFKKDCYCNYKGLRIYARIGRAQSLYRECKYAEAFARVLRTAGIECTVGSCHD